MLFSTRFYLTWQQQPGGLLTVGNLGWQNADVSQANQLTGEIPVVRREILIETRKLVEPPGQTRRDSGVPPSRRRCSLSGRRYESRRCPCIPCIAFGNPSNDKYSILQFTARVEMDPISITTRDFYREINARASMAGPKPSDLGGLPTSFPWFSPGGSLSRNRNRFHRNAPCSSEARGGSSR